MKNKKFALIFPCTEKNLAMVGAAFIPGTRINFGAWIESLERREVLNIENKPVCEVIMVICRAENETQYRLAKLNYAKWFYDVECNEFGDDN